MTAIADLLAGKTEGEWCEYELRDEVRDLVGLLRDARMAMPQTQAWLAAREAFFRSIEMSTCHDSDAGLLGADEILVRLTQDDVGFLRGVLREWIEGLAHDDGVDAAELADLRTQCRELRTKLSERTP